MPETFAAARIPGDHLHLLDGFVAVARRFPDDPGRHRPVRVTIRPDGERAGMPITWDGTQGTRIEVRAACAPDDDTARLYELSPAFAAARGAVACEDPLCFGEPR